MLNQMSNLGVASIRLGGRKVDELPIAESAITNPQLPVAMETERQNKIGNIKAKYPKQAVAYLEGRIKECEANIKNMMIIKQQQDDMISQYSSTISLCKYRDSQMEKLDKEDPEYQEKVKDLNKSFPPYNVKRMEEQIVQCKEASSRADEVVAKEYKSISELNQVVLLCKQRDQKLSELGAK